MNYLRAYVCIVFQCTLQVLVLCDSLPGPSVLASLNAIRGSYQSLQICEDGHFCVNKSDCSNPVGTCSEGRVCCAPTYTSDLPAHIEYSDSLDNYTTAAQNDSLDATLNMRSASRSGHLDRMINHGNRRFQTESYGGGPSFNERSSFTNSYPYDPYSNYNEYSNLDYGRKSYGVSPRGVDYNALTKSHGGYNSLSPHGNYGHGISRSYGGEYGHSIYPVRQPFYGNYNHAYRGNFGEFAPDFYGSRYDVRSLSVSARDLLHRYRYKQQCGLKQVGLFPDLPPYGVPPYAAQFGNYGPSRGVLTKFAVHPWQAAVLGWTPEGYGLRCSATIVHHYLLITSAHCLKGIVEPELKILLGVSDLLNHRPQLPPLERRVAKVFIHEDYDPDTLAHDVALLQLVDSVNFHFTPHVVPACLPETNRTFVATNCYIVGWTNSPYRGSLPSTNEISVSDMKFVQSKEECEKKILKEQDISQLARRLNSNKLTKEMHCITGDTATSCLSAIGGALYCDVPESTTCKGHGCPNAVTYLAGLVSWSNHRCGTSGLAVITELSPYVGWINELLDLAGGFKDFNPDFYGGFGLGYRGELYEGFGNYGPAYFGSDGYSGNFPQRPGRYPSPAYGTYNRHGNYGTYNK